MRIALSCPVMKKCRYAQLIYSPWPWPRPERKLHTTFSCKEILFHQYLHGYKLAVKIRLSTFNSAGNYLRNPLRQTAVNKWDKNQPNLLERHMNPNSESKLSRQICTRQSIYTPKIYHLPNCCRDKMTRNQLTSLIRRRTWRSNRQPLHFPKMKFKVKTAQRTNPPTQRHQK